MEPLLPSPVRHRRVWRFVLIAIAALLLLAVLVVVLLPSDQEVTWLTPAELAHATKPSPLTTIKRKLINLTAPFWRWHRSSRRSIQITSDPWILPVAASEQLGLGAPTTTNAAGSHAWILSPADFNALQQRLKTIPGALLSGAATLQIVDGGQSHVVIAQNRTMIMGQLYMAPGAMPPPAFIISLFPKAASHSVKLFVDATRTENPDSASTNPIIIKTNFAATCAAVVPNNGGLVLDGGKPGGTNAQSYWLILSPSMFDANGNAIKP